MRKLVVFIALLALVALQATGVFTARSLAREASAESAGLAVVNNTLTETATGRLGGRVFQDDNGNGRQDTGEPGISGVTVRLTRPGSDHLCGTGDDLFVASVVTSANGAYSFGNLSAGSYCIAPDQSTVPSGFRLTTNNVPASYDLAQGEVCDDFNFGYQPRGAIGDRVWRDDNGNGVQDAGEPGINGVRVVLRDPGANGVCEPTDAALATVVTSGDGNYLFSGLAAGRYCVDVDETTVPAGFALTTNNDPLLVNLGPGQSFLNADFGYQPRGAIGDRVWRDDNGNGVQDAGEPGINGVRVVLRDPGANGVCEPTDAALATVVTSGDGNYLFSGLAAGRYCVDVDETTVPAGFALTTNNDPLTVNLGAGQTFLDADFGYRELVCGLTVNGRCLVTPPTTQNLVCRDKIVATTLRYIGPSITGATVEFRPDRSPAVRYTNVNLVSGETVLTLPGENGFTVDARPDSAELGAKTTILINGVAQIIHTSCSTPYVAGQPAPLDDKSPPVPGNPNPSKGDPSPTWFVENFFDKSAGLIQLPSPPQLSESCSVQAGRRPGCTTEGKPTSLTFRYTGAACDPTGNNQGSKFVCSGSPNNAEPVQLVVTRDADKISVSPSGQTIRVGDLVTLTRTDGRTFAADTFLAIRQGNTTLQSLTIHTSCSQPLAVGDRFGSLTLVAFNGKRAGAEVTFITEVRNSATGAPLSDVRVTDSPFNNRLNPFGFALGTGASRQLDPVVANIETTTNYRVTAVGTLPNGQACTASDTVPVTVTPTQGPQSCTSRIRATRLEYTGPAIFGATVVFQGRDGGVATYSNIDLTPGTVLDAQNGFTIDARPGALGSSMSISINGQVVEVHHTSCSTPYIAGRPAPLDGNSPGVTGNPQPEKGDPSPNWRVVAFAQ